MCAVFASFDIPGRFHCISPLIYFPPVWEVCFNFCSFTSFSFISLLFGVVYIFIPEYTIAILVTLCEIAMMLKISVFGY